MAEMIRVNTRISKTLNEWLDAQTEETGVSKSTQIMMALENYRREKEVMGRMGEMEKLLQKLQEFSEEKKN